MKKIIILFMVVMLSGCMTHNQLEAEKAFYQMQTASIRSQQQAAAQPLWEMKSQQEGKPIVLENVDYIRVYQPIQQSQQQQQMVQYRQQDYVSPWTNLLGKAISLAIPAYAAYKIIDTVSTNTGTHTNMNNYGANSQQSIAGDTSISGATGGDINLHSDFTSDPTVVNQPEPIVVNQPEPIIVQ